MEPPHGKSFTLLQASVRRARGVHVGAVRLWAGHAHPRHGMLTIAEFKLRVLPEIILDSFNPNNLDGGGAVDRGFGPADADGLAYAAPGILFLFFPASQCGDKMPDENVVRGMGHVSSVGSSYVGWWVVQI